MLQYRAAFRRTIFTSATVFLTLQFGLAQRGTKPPPNAPNIPVTRWPGTSTPQPNAPPYTVNPYTWSTITTSDTQQKQRTPPGAGTVYAPELRVPDEARKQYEAGYRAITKDQYKVAEEHFSRAIELYPPYSSAFTMLGTAYLKDHDNASAHRAFSQALSLNPNNDMALRNLAYLVMSEGKTEDGEALLRKATVLAPLDMESQALLGYAELKMKQYDAALVTAKRFGKSDIRKYPFVHLMLAMALESKGDYRQSAKEYREYLKKSNDLQGQSMAVRGLARLEKRQANP